MKITDFKKFIEDEFNLTFKKLIDPLNINKQNNEGKTALSYATITENMKMVNLLLKNGADANIRDKNGFTAIFGAIGNYKIAKLLINYKADVNVQNQYGNTPLIGAVIAKEKLFIKLLLQNGANVNTKNNKGQIALDFARTDKIKNLLKAYEKT